MGGRTIVFILSESHFVFHSYPENNYFLIDLYVCDLTIDLKEIASKIVNSLQVKEVQQEIHPRGVPGTWMRLKKLVLDLFRSK